MLFNSFEFIVLVLVTFSLYYLKPLQRFQILLLIAASFVFYAYSQPWLLLLLVISAGINAVCSYRVLEADQPTVRIRWAVSGVVSNLLILAFFKYQSLIAESLLGDLSKVDGVGQLLLTLPLPIGISFYTFQGISLLVDVLRDGHWETKENSSRGDIDFTRHLKHTFLYITLFSQLVAGPILKAHEFFPQIKQKFLKDIHWESVVKYLITGYFLKMVVADNLQQQTIWIEYPFFLNFTGLDLSLLLVGFSAQIFADFAGYSLIAIGTAGLFGYYLPQNFNFPYIAQSFSDFWRRWHISLSSWLREYLYIPLGGNRRGEMRTYLNLILVMFLGGLWHGAAWSYAIWGLWHGLALALERPLRNTWFFTNNSLFMQSVRIWMVFSFVSMSWILFKLPEFSHVMVFVETMVTQPFSGFGLGLSTVISLIMYSSLIFIYHMIYLIKENSLIRLEPLYPLAYSIMLAGIVFNSGNSHAFIYFQF